MVSLAFPNSSVNIQIPEASSKSFDELPTERKSRNPRMPRGMAGILQSFSSSQCGYISTSGGTLGLYLLIDFSIELGVEANIHSAVQNNAIKS